MIIKEKINLLGLMAAAGIMDCIPGQRGCWPITGNEKKIIPAGCKEYDFGDFKTIASSEKSAIKKYNKFKNNKLK